MGLIIYHSGFFMPVMNRKIVNSMMKGCDRSSPDILKNDDKNMSTADSNDPVTRNSVESFWNFSL